MTRKKATAPAPTTDDRGPEDDAAAKGSEPKAAEGSKPAAEKDPRGTERGDPVKLREKLGEPAPASGAKLDPKTGRVEVPAPGTFDASKRKPQTA